MFTYEKPPLPTVQLLYGDIYISEEVHPIIDVTPIYSPTPDEKYPSVLQCFPSPLINTADYVQQVLAQGYASHFFTATATNPSGIATDTTTYMLLGLHHFVLDPSNQFVDHGERVRFIVYAEDINSRIIDNFYGAQYSTDYPFDIPLTISWSPDTLGEVIIPPPADVAAMDTDLLPKSSGTQKIRLLEKSSSIGQKNNFVKILSNPSVKKTLLSNSNSYKGPSKKIRSSLQASTSSINCTYFDAQGLEFVANGSLPMQPQQVTITVTRADDPTKSGTGSVTVTKGNTLKILNHQPWDIWPYLPSQIDTDGKRESRGADRPGYIPNRTFEIQVYGGTNQPLKGEDVTISTIFEQLSGGHQHDYGDVDLPQKKQGFFFGQGQKWRNPITLTTDANGSVKVDSFIAPQISGKYLVTATLGSDASICDTVNMQIRVPNLVNFRDNIILGEKPYIFWQSDTGTANHPSNTWCDSAMGNTLFLAILDFYQWTQSEENGGRAIQTSINDMSLVWGGLFDIQANWKITHPSHSFHRVGLSVDINKGKMNTAQIKKLTHIVTEDHQGKRNPERPQIHYGFIGGN